MMENLIPQLGQRLFPATRKRGWKSSSPDVPEICDHCSQPSPAQAETAKACFALVFELLAKNFIEEVNF